MTLAEVAAHWQACKFAVEDWLGLSADAMHVHVGMLLYLLFALAARRPVGDVLPWLGVLLVELGNEYLDLHQPTGSPETSWMASRHDVLNTMVLPTALLLVLRWRARGGRRRAKL